MAKGDGIIWSIDIDEEEQIVPPSDIGSDPGSDAGEYDPSVHGKPDSDKRGAVYPGWDITPDHGSDGGEEGERYEPPQYTPLPPVPQTEYVSVTRTRAETITDFSQESIDNYVQSGAYAVRIYEDGFAERCQWSEVSDPHQVIQELIEFQDAEARRIVGEVNQAVTEANARLDAQALIVEENKEAITDIREDITEFKETAEATYSTKVEVNEVTGAITRTLEADYATKAENVASTRPNLSPFFSHILDDFANAINNTVNAPWTNDDAYWLFNAGASWEGNLGRKLNCTVTELEDGWAHVVAQNTQTSGEQRLDFIVTQPLALKEDSEYTWLFEFRNNNSINLDNRDQIYIVQYGSNFAKNIWFWGSGVKKILEGSGVSSGTNLSAGKDFPPGTPGIYRKRFVKLTEKTGSARWDSTAKPRTLANLVFITGANSTIDVELRISLYEGEYMGDYKPYVPPVATLALKHEVEETAESFRRTLTEDYATKDELTGATTNLATKSEVQQTAANITQTVSQTYATKATVEAMKIGTRNLLLGTSTPRWFKRSSNPADYPNPDNPGAWGSYGARTESVVRTTDGIKMIQGPNGSGSSGLVIPLSHDNAVVSGKEYVLSFKYRTNMPNTGNIYFLKRTGANYSMPNAPLNNDGEWHVFEKVLSPSWTDDRVTYALLIFYRNVDGEWAEVADASMCLVEGNEFSSWGPAPEDLLTSDLASTIYTSKTTFDQTTDAINLKAEAALRRDPTNLLLDWNAPSLTKVDAPGNRYFSDGGSTAAKPCAVVPIADPPEPGILYGARISADGSQTGNGTKSAIAFYGDNKNPPMEEGQDYTFSFWARKLSGTCAYYCQIGRNPYIRKNNSHNYSAANELSTEWKQIVFTFKYTVATCGGADYGGAIVYPGIVFKANTAGSGEV